MTIISSPVIKHATIIWDYFQSFESSQASEAMIVCCSYDLRVLDHAVQLLPIHEIQKVVLSGNKGNWTNKLWKERECDVFYAHQATVLSKYDVILEGKSTNFSENIIYSSALISPVNSILFVTKPNSILRVVLTVHKQWPGIKFSVTCPKYRFPDEVSNIVGLFGLISEMVGDIDRIVKYPSMGYQIKHELPDSIISSWEFLIKEGFDQHLVR